MTYHFILENAIALQSLFWRLVPCQHSESKPFSTGTTVGELRHKQCAVVICL